MNKSGMVTTLAGSGNSGFTDGIGVFAAFSDPKAIAVDLAGNLLVFDGGRLRNIDPTGKVSTRTDLTAILADYAIGSANQLTIDSVGSIYIATASRILKILADGRVTTAAGGSNSGFQDGPVLSAKFCQITGFAFDSSGAIYIADACNNRIRKVTTAGEEIVPSADVGIALYPGLTVSGVVGRSYRVEFITNIDSVGWQSIVTILLERNPSFWVDQSATNSERRFYRVISLP
jgi:hypothetical protein